VQYEQIARAAGNGMKRMSTLAINPFVTIILHDISWQTGYFICGL
jgi:hypothetical protein